MDLSAVEIRVLGCLIEKQRTTPDVYPLSLNSLRLACNQSTNRDPVCEYDESTLREALRRLHRRGLVRLASGHTSRAEKYRHLLADALPMGDDEQSVMCVLMLRGTQTPGELKQRTERLHRFESLGEMHETLARLIDRGLAERLERRPGQKEERYAHLLAGEEEDGATPEAPQSAGGPVAAAPMSGEAGALAQLTERVARLEEQVAELRARLGEEAAGEEAGGEDERPAEPERATAQQEPAEENGGPDEGFLIEERAEPEPVAPDPWS